MIAITLTLIASALLLASRYGLLQGSYEDELNLAGYLDLVSTVAAAAPDLREFPAAPGFTTVSWPEARAKIDFPVIAPEDLPGGYRLTTVRLYNRGELHEVSLSAFTPLFGLAVYLLYGVSANFTATFTLLEPLPVGVVVVACYLPARRATKVNPMITLRNEG